MIRVSIKRRATDSDRYTSAYVIHSKQCMAICLSFAGKVAPYYYFQQSLDDVSDAKRYCYSYELDTLQQFDTPTGGICPWIYRYTTLEIYVKIHRTPLSSTRSPYKNRRIERTHAFSQAPYRTPQALLSTEKAPFATMQVSDRNKQWHKDNTAASGLRLQYLQSYTSRSKRGLNTREGQLHHSVYTSSKTA